VTSGTAAWFGSLTPSSNRRMPLRPSAWTCIGGLAIPLWATWPALSLETREIPPLECLTLVFFVSWLVLRFIEQPVVARDTRALSGQSWIPAVAFALGESGSAVFFLLATHYVAAAEANLILYLWPVMVVAFGAAFRIFHLRARHIAGIVVGFAATAILMGGSPLSLWYPGIGLALLGGLSWAVYCVFRLRWKGSTDRLLARGFGLSAVLCGATHLLFEPSVTPSTGAAAAAAVIGIVPSAFANLAWDEGFRRGDSHLLAVMAYATPLCSTLLLVVLGFQAPTSPLILSAGLIVLAGFLARASG
jgi:drug/metabolite transporter (DMT)-like permease